jgi:hypothetical protein
VRALEGAARGRSRCRRRRSSCGRHRAVTPRSSVSRESKALSPDSPSMSPAAFGGGRSQSASRKDQRRALCRCILANQYDDARG